MALYSHGLRSYGLDSYQRHKEDGQRDRVERLLRRREPAHFARVCLEPVQVFPRLLRVRAERRFFFGVPREHADGEGRGRVPDLEGTLRRHVSPTTFPTLPSDSM